MGAAAGLVIGVGDADGSGGSGVIIGGGTEVLITGGDVGILVEGVLVGPRGISANGERAFGAVAIGGGVTVASTMMMGVVVVVAFGTTGSGASGTSVTPGARVAVADEAGMDDG